jgi:hypothetical protein
MKTTEQLRKLSKNEAKEIAQCMLPHMEKWQSKLDQADEEKRKSLIELFKNELEKSEYKEVINSMEPEKIKKLAESDISSSSDNSAESPSTRSASRGSEDWDAVLDDYEEYVDNYIKLYKKAMEGDMDAMSEYPALMEKAKSLSEKLERAKGDMSAQQLERMGKIQTKMMNAAMQ